MDFRFPLVLLLALFALLAARQVLAHESPTAKPGDATPTPLSKPKRDPQAYFTDRELLTQDGARVRFYSDVLKGRLVVLNTIFTNCEDACPLITTQMNAVRAKLGPAFGRDVHFVTITSDPQRDTPQALKKWAGRRSADVPGWTFLTGKKSDVEHILQKLGQWSQNIESHSTQLVAWNFVTDRGRKMLPNLPPETIAAQLTLLMGGDALVPLPLLAPPPSN
ncbi:MAG: SCO family protein [Burkholderiaceae bacterium]